MNINDIKRIKIDSLTSRGTSFYLLGLLNGLQELIFSKSKKNLESKVIDEKNRGNQKIKTQNK